MGDFVPLHADKPGMISPRDVSTKHYRAVQSCGPFEAGAEFSAWAWGEAFAWIHGKISGPICKNGEIADWLKAGLLERA
jgi:hypothetical protein